MSIFSSKSKSTSTNTQTTNNTSVSTAFNQSGAGTAIWGSNNNIISTDNGAMQIASNMAQDGLSAAKNIAETGAGLASDLFKTATGLAGAYNAQMGATASGAMSLVDSVNDKLAGMTGKAFDLSSAFAADGAKLARDAMTYGGNLAREFGQSALESSKQAQQTVLDGAKYAMQFADNASRSDGQQYAIEANKSQMYTMLGVAALVALVLFTRGK